MHFDVKLSLRDELYKQILLQSSLIHPLPSTDLKDERLQFLHFLSENVTRAKMRSCMLALAWLGAVLLLALQRGSGARATPAVAVTATKVANLAGPMGGARLTRLTRQDPAAASREVIGARYARRLDALVDEDKREFDDYGHMRFGKRGQQQSAAGFDDYGHMRFGRSGSD